MAKRFAPPREPIWTRPAPGTRAPRLTRDQIARAALAIADTEGFEAVSMRRVAEALDAGTMTLYYYVKTKDDLLTLMHDAIMGEVLVPDAELAGGWRPAMAAIARATRDTFVRHPWSLYALREERVGPNGIRHVEQSLAALRDLEIGIHGKVWILTLVDDYVFGHAMRTAEMAEQPRDPRVMNLIADFFERQLDTGGYPELNAVFAQTDIASALTEFTRWISEPARFELGLTVLLDGLERDLADPRSRLRALPPMPVAGSGPAKVRAAGPPVAGSVERAGHRARPVPERAPRGTAGAGSRAPHPARRRG